MSKPDATTRLIPPCKDCAERYTACHDHCEKFKRYKATREKENKARKAYEQQPFVRYDPFNH